MPVLMDDSFDRAEREAAIVNRENAEIANRQPHGDMDAQDYAAERQRKRSILSRLERIADTYGADAQVAISRCEACKLESKWELDEEAKSLFDLNATLWRKRADAFLRLQAKWRLKVLAARDDLQAFTGWGNMKYSWED